MQGNFQYLVMQKIGFRFVPVILFCALSVVSVPQHVHAQMNEVQLRTLIDQLLARVAELQEQLDAMQSIANRDTEDHDFDVNVSDNLAVVTFTRYSGCPEYTIKWGDGAETVSQGSRGPCTSDVGTVTERHRYDTPGTYAIRLEYRNETYRTRVTIESDEVVSDGVIPIDDNELDIPTNPIAAELPRPMVKVQFEKTTKSNGGRNGKRVRLGNGGTVKEGKWFPLDVRDPGSGWRSITNLDRFAGVGVHRNGFPVTEGGRSQGGVSSFQIAQVGTKNRENPKERTVLALVFRDVTLLGVAGYRNYMEDKDEVKVVKKDRRVRIEFNVGRGQDVVEVLFKPKYDEERVQRVLGVSTSVEDDIRDQLQRAAKRLQALQR